MFLANIFPGESSGEHKVEPKIRENEDVEDWEEDYEDWGGENPTWDEDYD
ncbi:hypothetical protein GYB22_04460 [bacterium]|nr:hypothetical protein [bacterium]